MEDSGSLAKEKKPTVLIIENSIDLTGALKSITRSSYDLSQYFNFKFLIPRKARGRFWIEQAGFRDIIEIPFKEISRRLASILLYVPYLIANAIKLKRITRKENVTLIHLNDIYNLVPVASRLLGENTPYVCHVRFLPDRFPKFLFNTWLDLHLKFAHKIIAVSQSVKAQLPNHPKITVIHNEAPLEERLPYVGPQHRPSHPFNFLYLSNFIDGKGQQFALAAFSQIHSTLPDWKLRFVGGDMGMHKNKIYRDKLIAEANKLGIGDKVEFESFVADVEKEYKNADIVLNFSESESFSFTCLEALFYGCALIASDCGGPTEIIDHYETGILVPNRDVEKMKEAMISLASDINLRSQFGSKARTVVRDRFSINNTSYRLKKVYDEAAGAKRNEFL
jgi:glycosyltransferase involved in cell wall biosynthesis